MYSTFLAADARRKVTAHPYLARIREAPLDKEALATLIGQYYHVVRCFCPFLARTISEAASPEAQTYLAVILDQELGSGDPAKAHLRLYVETMRDAGINEENITNSAPNDATTRLVRAYEEAAKESLRGIGFICGTELIDLPMVAAVGRGVKLSTDHEQLPWVDIHVAQEPDHVQNVGNALLVGFDAGQQKQVAEAAEKLWDLWAAFFDALHEDLGPNA